MDTSALDRLRPAAAPLAQADTGPVLELRGISVQFGKLRAVDNVSLKLEGGQFLGLLGSNGAGKTTLMRTICGLQVPHGGEVRLLGEPLSPQTNHLLRHVGFTPDTPALYDGLTLRQFLRFVGRQYDITAADTDERIDLWLEKLWLTEKADTKIKGLSRGMRQRIGIARTLLPNPALVVLDEPAAGLDPAGRAEFRNLLGDLRKQGKAVIVSSHVLSDLADQCTHIGLMNSGRLERFESIAQFTGRTDASKTRYDVKLARPMLPNAELIANLPGVVDGRVTENGLSLEAGSSADEAAALLAELVKRGLPVSAFGPAALDLEQAYLRASDNRVR
ncbi:MAG: ABC transporter ATP-binding protein [Tepidisphaeraceae bacterium]